MKMTKESVFSFRQYLFFNYLKLFCLLMIYYLPSIESLVKDIQPITLMNFLSDEYVDTVLLDIVPKTMERFGMNDIIAVTKAYRCFEDFDDRPSQQKTDFKNSYYHRKTKHPMIISDPCLSCHAVKKKKRSSLNQKTTSPIKAVIRIKCISIGSLLMKAIS